MDSADHIDLRVIMNPVADTPELTQVLRAIANHDHALVMTLLSRDPHLATASLARRDEAFLPERFVQLYEGDTALHAAAFSYDSSMVRTLISRGADIRATNRRGAQPLHAATTGNPNSVTWNPVDQCNVILLLIELGADPNATASGGVTPLHRSVRNRCSAAVDALLRGGADPHVTNDNGSTARDLATATTGRGGSGSSQAKAEQARILELLEEHGA